MQDKIIVKGARANNLKNIDVTIPRDKLVVMTGLSGSGKSSLAFDTIYAEGQRRYVESLSSYARMFLGQMDKPDVDYIDGLSPAISIDQKTTSKNPRSTVGTVTEIYDYLRLLWARVGTPHCPKCGKDLVMKTSAKTRGSFIGCMGWPDCDVTYPVPSGVKVSPLEGEAAVCSECGAPRIKCQPFRQKAFEICVNPTCPTNYEPDLKVGECKVCAEAGRHGDLIAHKSEKSGKRFIRCTNYDDCGVSYPLPARGKLEATGETCPECGAPIVVVNTARGPWRICVNMDCPTKEKKPARGRKTTTKASTAKKATAAKKTSTAKKSTAKKAAAKKTTTKKPATDK